MALFSLASETGQEKKYLDDLEQIGGILADCPDYLAFLETPTIPKSERIGALSAAFSENLPEYLLSFLQILAEKNEIRSLPDCIDDYRALYFDFAGIAVAKVTSARALSEAEKARLQSALEKRTGKSVRLQFERDPALIGGLIAEIDGVRYDGSLRGRISQVKEVMQE